MLISDAAYLAVMKMKEFGLTDRGWKLQFNNTKTTLGLCCFRIKTIKLSRAFVEVNEERTVLDTILHEIAHALLPPTEKHSIVWSSLAKSIGCNGKRLDNESIAPEKKRIGTCPKCGKVIRRHRAKNLACGSCCRFWGNGKFDARFKFVWS
jgi:hypothetical protein